MEGRGLSLLVASVLSVMLSATIHLAGQEHGRDYHHYKLVDLGTLGGPGGGIVSPSAPVINHRGALVGVSDTSIADPFAPNCFLDCNVSASWIWQDGVLKKLSALGDGLSTLAGGINDRGLIIGQVQNGAVDPGTSWPQTVAAIWKNGKIHNLGTLGGTQADPTAINNRGQVVGTSLTGTADPFANSPVGACIFMPTSGYGPYCATVPFARGSVFFPATTESHGFVWEKGVMHDLGTLGGPDSDAWMINDRGQIVGFSYTSYVANSSSGVPTIDPFLWDPATRNMTDLGGFGGTVGTPQWINNRGQVVGSSNLAGDVGVHPFLWSDGVMTDLGTSGGPFGVAFSVNDAGEVVGTLQNTAQTAIYAFYWKDGVIQTLGTVDGDPCSQAFSINKHGLVVGVSDDCATGADLHGFLWQNGAAIVDVNALVVPASTSTVVSNVYANDTGEIGCLIQHPDGSGNACVLIPCDDDHPGIEGCDYSMVDRASVLQIDPRRTFSPERFDRAMRGLRLQRPRLGN